MYIRVDKTDRYSVQGGSSACARRSWRDPAGGSPVREGGSARPVASVAGSSATMVATRTQRDDEDYIELRKILTVEAEALRTAAGPLCGIVMRGTGAKPESETSSSRQGSCRNLGDRVSRTQARRVCGAVWKMKDRPFEVGFREQASNHPKRHRSKAGVVSVDGKRYRSGVDHGDERERTTDDVSKGSLATSKPGAGLSPGTRLGGAR